MYCNNPLEEKINYHNVSELMKEEAIGYILCMLSFVEIGVQDNYQTL